MDNTIQLKVATKPFIDPDSGEFKVEVRVELPIRGNGLQRLHPALVNQDAYFAGEHLNYNWGNVDLKGRCRYRVYFLEELQPEEMPLAIKTEVERLGSRFRELVLDFKHRASKLLSPAEYTIEVEL